MVGSLRVLAVAGLLTSIHKLGGAAIEASGRMRFEYLILMLHALLVTVGSLIAVGHGIVAVS